MQAETHGLTTQLSHFLKITAMCRQQPSKGTAEGRRDRPRGGRDENEERRVEAMFNQSVCKVNKVIPGDTYS